MRGEREAQELSYEAQEHRNDRQAAAGPVQDLAAFPSGSERGRGEFPSGSERPKSYLLSAIYFLRRRQAPPCSLPGHNQRSCCSTFALFPKKMGSIVDPLAYMEHKGRYCKFCVFF
jgi:hypothetical protein